MNSMFKNALAIMFFLSACAATAQEGSSGPAVSSESAYQLAAVGATGLVVYALYKVYQNWSKEEEEPIQPVLKLTADNARELLEQAGWQQGQPFSGQTEQTKVILNDICFNLLEIVIALGTAA